MIFAQAIAVPIDEETEVELILCQLLKHTPAFVIYRLHEKSECLSQVKTFGSVICLRDTYNQVK